MLVLYTVILLAFPAGILWLTHSYRWANKLGVIVLCYLAGLAAGNSGVFPEQTLQIREGITEISIALALPMLLFTLDIRQWGKVAGKAMLSMLFATISVVALATGLFFALNEQGTEAVSNLAAMSVGVYTGGTPNLAAIKAGLDIPHDEYIVFHSLDTAVSAIYVLAMLSVGVSLFRRILNRPAQIQHDPDEDESHADEDDFRPLLKRENLPELMKVAALSVVVLLLSLGVSRLLGSAFSMNGGSALVIVTLTTLGILLSLIPRVQGMRLAYKAGMYLIYVFCFAVASMASFDKLMNLDASAVIFLIGTVVGSLSLHALLCKLARIDSDTFMVTSMAAICSPPFVPLMARALGNRSTILSGMTTGIIGYALGNYLGISLGLLLKSL